LGVPGVAHGFTSREGGHSTDAFRSLNLGLRIGDPRAAVEMNRRTVLHALGRDEAASSNFRRACAQHPTSTMPSLRKSSL